MPSKIKTEGSAPADAALRASILANTEVLHSLGIARSAGRVAQVPPGGNEGLDGASVAGQKSKREEKSAVGGRCGIGERETRAGKRKRHIEDQGGSRHDTSASKHARTSRRTLHLAMAEAEAEAAGGASASTRQVPQPHRREDLSAAERGRWTRRAGSASDASSIYEWDSDLEAEAEESDAECYTRSGNAREDDVDGEAAPGHRAAPSPHCANTTSFQKSDTQAKRRAPRLGERAHDPETFGPIPGVRVGAWWPTRMACSTAAVHAPTVAGISGTAAAGCYSLCVSGGYEDDVDLGAGLTYTGSGGRDLRGTRAHPKNLRTAAQSRDQTFGNPLNASLVRSEETQRPVRVVRGYKGKGPYFPPRGYVYSGLYRVQKHWRGEGLSGFLVCRFVLKRVEGQEPLPVFVKKGGENADGEADELVEGEMEKEEARNEP